jgi:poly-gamma-glutamate capsule biosynthesis protein CapA/YwtB (metallophosphatase superfamily)
LTLFVCGDVMLGRGIDQILPNPGDPTLREPYVRDARTYVRLAVERNGRIPSPVEYGWPWGHALEVLDDLAPDLRIVNLETSATRSNDFAPGKDVHYRMTPENLPALAIACPNACVLANNHVMDFGVQGLTDTIRCILHEIAGTVGVGHDATEANQPVIVSVAGSRIIIFACGMGTSGVPASWAATQEQPGVSFLSRPTDRAADDISVRVQGAKHRGDVVVVSIHWGGNWGYEVSREEVHFAHRLIDAGVDIVHGHSSHHPRPVEVYRGKLILYGCGDFIDDYEGISGHEGYRPDLRLMYFPTIDLTTGELLGMRMVPVQARRMRLEPATSADARWAREVLDRVSRPFGSRVRFSIEGQLTLEWK